MANDIAWPAVVNGPHRRVGVRHPAQPDKAVFRGVGGWDFPCCSLELMRGQDLEAGSRVHDSLFLNEKCEPAQRESPFEFRSHNLCYFRVLTPFSLKHCLAGVLM